MPESQEEKVWLKPSGPAWKMMLVTVMMMMMASLEDEDDCIDYDDDDEGEDLNVFLV